jgi:hypothetical protein
VGNHSRSRGASRAVVMANDGLGVSEPLVSRRWFGRAMVVGVPAAVVLARQGKAEAAATGSWSVSGNAGTAAGTNFLGTTDSQALVVKTANVERLRVASSGSVGIGTTAPAGQLNVVSASQIAVKGDYTGTGSSAGVRGSTTSHAANASAVSGVLDPSTPGVGSAAVLGTVPVKKSTGVGVLGHHAGTGIGVMGHTDGKGVGVQGLAASGTVDRIHPTEDFYPAGGEFCGYNGVIGAASTDTDDGFGVLGIANSIGGIGVYALGVGGATALQAAGYCIFSNDVTVDGDLYVGGTLTKGGGAFRIDHPLAPAEKYLWHSFVESPDMMNIYNGTVVLDSAGSATVTMPAWFEPLNRDFRYQLTALGSPGPNLHVSRKITDVSFSIGGGSAGQEVSWQVTGIRQDAWANAHRIPVESDKPANLRGTYLHPELFGKTTAEAEHQPATQRTT